MHNYANIFEAVKTEDKTSDFSFTYVFPRFDAARTGFPVLGTTCKISRARHRLLVFPRLIPVTCFPALDTGCLFSRA